MIDLNKTLKKILLFIVEVILITAIWTFLDHLIGDSINIVKNLRSVTILVLISNAFDYKINKNNMKD